MDDSLYPQEPVSWAEDFRRRYPLHYQAAGLRNECEHMIAVRRLSGMAARWARYITGLYCREILGYTPRGYRLFNSPRGR